MAAFAPACKHSAFFQALPSHLLRLTKLPLYHIGADSISNSQSSLLTLSPMAPEGEAYNVDWVISNNSDVHVAQHLDWFTSFTRFSTGFSTGFQSDNENAQVKVIGIGDVALPVKTRRGQSGGASQGILMLHDVLYAPDSVSNIVGGHITDNFGLILGFNNNSMLKDPNKDTCVAIIDRPRLFRLRLKGQSPHQSSLNKDSLYFIRANWPPSERERWEAHKEQLARPCVPTLELPTSRTSDEGYTSDEKQWLKKHWGDEFRFLRDYGLSIYDEEQRAEGRQLARQLMQDETDSDEAEFESDFLRDLERDPTSHVADHHFSETELDWIEKHYNYSSNFLRSYGLKFYDDEDCREGKAILRTLMEDGQ